MITIFTTILSIALSVAAQFSLKAGTSSAAAKNAMVRPLCLRAVLIIVSNKFVLGGCLLYGRGAVAWLGVLSGWDVSKAYPLVGCGVTLPMMVGVPVGKK